MRSTRSSARLNGNTNGNSSQPDKTTNGNSADAGTKRKAAPSTSPAQKRGRKASSTRDAEPKEQKTIEQTMDIDVDKNAPNDAEMKVAAEQAEDKNNDAAEEKITEDNTATTEPAADDAPASAPDEKRTAADASETKPEKPEDASSTKQKEATPAAEAKALNSDADAAATADTSSKEDGPDSADHKSDDVKQTTTSDATGKIEQHQDKKADADAKAATNEGGAVEVSQERKDAMPSSILEKGLIYFFVRARVGMDDPSGVQDIARSYIVLRPLPHGAKLTAGTLDDTKTNRLLALPKKVLPKSRRDVFMTFVEKAGATIAELKEEFMKGSDYATKTTGVSHSPPVTPIGEGVYALTTTGRDSHLAYILTIPNELGEVQKEMGLSDKGSFACSVKNPSRPGPANTNLPQGPDFPKEIMEEFSGRGWGALQPKHLEYANAQFILIGQAQGEFGSALDANEKDSKDDSKETPLEEMEKLEGEDEHRMEGLSGDDSVYEDLGLARKEFPSLATTW